MNVKASFADDSVRLPAGFPDLPANWGWVHLAQSCAGIYDCPHSTPELTNSGPYLVRTQDYPDGVLRLDGMARVSEETYTERVRRAVPQRGDILYSREGSYHGIAAEVPDGHRVCMGQRMVLIRPDRNVLNFRFLRFWLNSSYVRGFIEGMREGSGAPRINMPTIRKLLVPAPPIDEQNSVARLLGALDDKIAVNERVATTALDLAEARYVQASEDPKWDSVALSDAAQWFSGGTPKTGEAKYWGGDVPWISALSLKSPWIDSSDRNVTELGEISGTRTVPANVVLFVVRGSSLKTEFRIGITRCKVAFGQDCKALVAKHGIDPHVLFHGIRSRATEILEMVDETSIGAGRLSTDLISKFEIKVPGRTGSPLVDELRTLDDLAAERQVENRSLTTLRDTLLPQLMSGRLRVKDAEKIVEDQV